MSIERVLQKEGKLLSDLSHMVNFTLIIKVLKYLSVFVREVRYQLLEELLRGDCGVHELAQGDVRLFPHALSRVSQPEM